MNKNILILGHARHGKDTVAEIMEELNGYSHISSSVKALDVFLYDLLRDKYGMIYKNKQEAYLDRVNHREIWFNEIQNYNKDDESRLAKEIMKSVDMYVGLRRYEEVEKCIEDKVFDFIIAVHDYRKPLESVKSNTVDPFKYADIIIPNNGTLEDLKRRVKSVKEMLKL